jgi:hypothetical protein
MPIDNVMNEVEGNEMLGISKEWEKKLSKSP